MKYYIQEVYKAKTDQKTAGIKARDDVEEILESLSYRPIVISSIIKDRKDLKKLKKVLIHKETYDIWKKTLSFLKSEDELIVQFPIKEHSIFLSHLFKIIQNRNIKVSLIIHDLELLRTAKRQSISRSQRLRLKIEEENMLKICSKIIVHNEKMKNFVSSLGIDKNKLISLEIFDYLIDDLKKEQLKKNKKAGKIGNHLLGKNIVLLFEKTSTRTRCSFEVAALDEGGHVTFLSNSQMGKKESIEDTAKVLGRMYDGIEFRGFKQETVEALAKYSGVPVWNGLTDVDHPTQTLADFLTIEEHLNKPLNEVKFVFCGDIRNNVCYGLMYGAVKMGMHFVCLGPKQLHIDEDVLKYCQQEAKKSGGKIEVLDNVDEAVKDADVIYTDVWVSMGEPDEVWEERIRELTPYKVTKEVMNNASQKAIFLHCLPAFHDLKTKIGKDMGQQFGITDMEVTDEVFESSQSVVFDEAENRMHTIKAVIMATLGV